MSVVAAGDLYREGWLLVAGKEAAVLVKPGEEDVEWDSIQLVLDKNGIPRLPVSETKQAAARRGGQVGRSLSAFLSQKKRPAAGEEAAGS